MRHNQDWNRSESIWSVKDWIGFLISFIKAAVAVWDGCQSQQRWRLFPLRLIHPFVLRNRGKAASVNVASYSLSRVFNPFEVTAAIQEGRLKVSMSDTK